MSDNVRNFAAEEAAMRIDEIASFVGSLPTETRLMALLAVVGHKSPECGLPAPIYGDGETHVYAFSVSSQAILAALETLLFGGKTVAAVWLGELRPDADLVASRIRRVIECAEFGEPGQVVLTLAAVETARELLPEGARMVDIGNRSTGSGAIERFFVIQGFSRGDSNHKTILDQDVYRRFIGRSREVAELEDRITRYRLTTVCGPAGVGKTALVRRVLDDDPLTNNWYLDATNLSSPSVLTSTLTATLGIRKAPLQTHLEALLANAEELDGVLAIDAGTRELADVKHVVRQLLAVATKLAIVVISPRPLRMPNESVLPLRGLDYPKGPESWHSLREYDAVAFFEARAYTISRQFDLSPDDLEVVSIICRRLQGNPAALTLAANKLRALSPRQILDRLDQPLVFLKTTGGQDPERHRSLEAMIALTVAPMSDSAKTLLGCISAMEGAVGFDDLEAMFPKQATLYAFEELIDAGLLDASGASTNVKRFTMSSSTRVYARQSLSEGDFSTIEASRLAYFEQVALQSAAGLIGKDQAAWTRRMEDQCPDISSTIRVLIKQGEMERTVAALTAGITFWFERNFPSEGLSLAEAGLRRKANFPSKARLENFAAAMAQRLGDLKKAECYARRGLERAIASGNSRYQIFLYQTIGSIHHARNEMREGAENQKRAADIARECGERDFLHNALVNYTSYQTSAADYDQTWAAANEAFALETEQTPRSWKARLRSNIANLEMEHGSIQKAKLLLGEALDLLRESGHWVSAAVSVRTLAHCLISEERFEDAALLFGGARSLVEHEEGHLNEHERSMTDHGTRKIIAVLGPESFRFRYDSGRLLDVEEVLRFAIECSNS